MHNLLIIGTISDVRKMRVNSGRRRSRYCTNIREHRLKVTVEYLSQGLTVAWLWIELGTSWVKSKALSLQQSARHKCKEATFSALIAHNGSHVFLASVYRLVEGIQPNLVLWGGWVCTRNTLFQMRIKRNWLESLYFSILLNWLTF
jgi:hypothetical protein